MRRQSRDAGQRDPDPDLLRTRQALAEQQVRENDGGDRIQGAKYGDKRQQPMPRGEGEERVRRDVEQAYCGNGHEVAPRNAHARSEDERAGDEAAERADARSDERRQRVPRRLPRPRK